MNLHHYLTSHRKASPRWNAEVTVKPKTIKLVVKKKICEALGQTKMSEIGHKKHWGREDGKQPTIGLTKVKTFALCKTPLRK